MFQTRDKAIDSISKYITDMIACIAKCLNENRLQKSKATNLEKNLTDELSKVNKKLAERNTELHDTKEKLKHVQNNSDSKLLNHEVNDDEPKVTASELQDVAVVRKDVETKNLNVSVLSSHEGNKRERQLKSNIGDLELEYNTLQLSFPVAKDKEGKT